MPLFKEKGLNFENLRRKISRNFSDYGLFVTMRKGILYSANFLFEIAKYRIYTIDLNRMEKMQLKSTDFSYKFIESSDLEIIQQIEYMEEWLQGKIQKKHRS